MLVMLSFPRWFSQWTKPLLLDMIAGLEAT
jgi:hypothetical protein